MKRNAFTMIELLTVMMIMAVLGIASAASYAALQRGMRERAAVAAASALLKSAKERAAVDRLPTAVFCYNRLVKGADAAQDENAVVVGVMTAVRVAGRISYVRGNYLYDEFGDINLVFEAMCDDEDFSSDGKAYSESDLRKRTGMRLWQFPRSDEMKYSVVSDAVWCDVQMSETIFSGGASGLTTNCLMSAFYNLGHSKREPTWKTGDAYAFEIGELELPNGFIFGDSIPTDPTADQLCKVIRFNPENPADDTVEVNSTKPGSSGMPVKFKSTGRATSEARKAM